MANTHIFLLSVAAEAYSGKDTLCEYAAAHFAELGFNAYIRSFSFPFKSTLCAQAFGFDEEQLYGSRKEEVMESWGEAPRFFYQHIGDGLRQLISEDIWIKAPIGPIEYTKRNPHKICLIPDNRYPNENEAVKFYGGYTVKLQKEVRKEVSGGIEGHRSEALIGTFECHETIYNNDNIEVLQDAGRSVAVRALTHWRMLGMDIKQVSIK